MLAPNLITQQLMQSVLRQSAQIGINVPMGWAGRRGWGAEESVMVGATTPPRDQWSLQRDGSRKQSVDPPCPLSGAPGSRSIPFKIQSIQEVNLNSISNYAMFLQ